MTTKPGRELQTGDHVTVSGRRYEVLPPLPGDDLRWMAGHPTDLLEAADSGEIAALLPIEPDTDYTITD